MKVSIVKSNNGKINRNQAIGATNFKSGSAYGGLILLTTLYKKGKEAIRELPKNRVMCDLCEIIENDMRYNKNDIRMAYSTIASIPDNYYTIKDATSLVGQFFSNRFAPNVTMNDLRVFALTKMPYLLKDDSQYAVQAKKDFIKSFLDNGYEVPMELHNQFSGLNDSIYNDFKHEIIDTCLFSSSYAKKRDEKSKAASIATTLADYQYPLLGSIEVFNNKKFERTVFNNLALIATLDKSRHASFIHQRRNIINQSKLKVAELLEKSDKRYITGLMNYYMRHIKYL